MLEWGAIEMGEFDEPRVRRDGYGVPRAPHTIRYGVDAPARGATRRVFAANERPRTEWRARGQMMLAQRGVPDHRSALQRGLHAKQKRRRPGNVSDATGRGEPLIRGRGTSPQRQLGEPDQVAPQLHRSCTRVAPRLLLHGPCCRGVFQMPSKRIRLCQDGP